MIDGVDHLLRRLLLDQVPLLKPAAGGDPQDVQVGFQPPDKDWRKLVNEPALNVYLADLREHIEYRADEALRPATPWVDCHYLITAWSPATADVGGRLIEHAMLYQVVQALLARPRLRTAEIFRRHPFPAGYPAGLRDAELPATVVPGDGFAKLAEFWSAMGPEQVWRPAAYLVVAVPVPVPPPPSGPPVTTAALATGDETQIVIGGRVLTPAGAVAGAWVGLERTPGVLLTSARTDAAGRFRFGGLAAGRYRLRCRALGHAEPQPRDVDVPSATGQYDLTL